MPAIDIMAPMQPDRGKTGCDRTPRVAVLDGLRAMAIILVLMRHAVLPFWPDPGQSFLKLGPVELGSVFINGWMGVDLFFVLSGYLISSHLLGRYFDPSGRNMDLRSYARRRFLRIAPAYYAVLTIAVLGLFPFYPYPESDGNIGWRYFYHLLFMQDYFPSDIVATFWSLAIEIKFYLLAPFALMGLLRLPEKMRPLALFVPFLLLPLLRLQTAMAHPEITDYSSYFEQLRSVFHLTLDGLLAGMFCAILTKDKAIASFLQRPHVANTIFFAGLIIFVLAAFWPQPLINPEPSLFDKTLLPSVIAFAFGAMLLGLLNGTAGTAFFAWKGWYPVALISYSLYLVHLPLIYPAQVLCRLFFDLDTYAPSLQLALYAPFFAGLSVPAATISYFLLERPFMHT
jgi:peptidoglycan/LPS O-acetylase OafA/YrhL